MPLFEISTSPCGDRPKRHGESTYSYWRDSERGPMVAIRNLLESWFKEIPLEQQLDLHSRFRSRIERQHKSALFELFLHHFLSRCGFQVQFHPNMEGVTTHPDFLVSRDRQESRMDSLRARRHNAVHAQILDHLPIVVISVSRDEGCDDRPRVQTIDTVNLSVGILGSDRRERLVCISE